MSQLESEEVRRQGRREQADISWRVRERDGQIGKRKQELKAALFWRGRDGVIERWKDKEERR